MLVTLISLAHAGCPSDEGSLREAADAAERAWVEQGRDAFRERFRDVEGLIACLDELIDPDAAARLHLLLALSERDQLDDDAAVAALRGVLAADPDTDHAGRVVLEGTDFYALVERAREPFDDPGFPILHGDWAVDGHIRASSVPGLRATVVQAIAEDGTATTWHLPGDRELPVSLLAALEPPATRRSPRRPLALSAIATGVLSGASFAVAAITYGQGSATGVDPDRYGRLQGVNHVAAWGGPVLGVAAVGLGVSAVVVGP